MHFANQVLIERHNRLVVEAMGSKLNPPERPDLARVDVFRGLPSNKHQPNFYRRNQAQKSEWTRDRRVQVTYHPLKYHSDEARNIKFVEEKGVDVMVALDLVRSADRGEHDLIILASHDTDQ